MAEALTSPLADGLTGPAAAPPAADARHAGATTLVVENMHCGNCISKVEKALVALPGVASARANLSTRRVRVEHAGADTAALVDALADAGFKAAELTAAASAADANSADRDLLRRLAVAGFAAANIMLLSVSVWSGAGGDMPEALQSLFHWLSALIALPAVAYAGQPFFRSAAAALRARRVNMDVPISLGVTLATAMSLYQTVRKTDHVYFDAAITLLFFLLIGRVLDMRMRVRAAGAAQNLLGLKSAVASIVAEDGQVRRLATSAIQPGFKVLTAAGERFAVDGRIVAGESEIDESLITGETVPRRIAPDDTVYAGTVNLGQPVTMVASATGDATLVAEIARLMSAVEQGKASYVRLADRAARLYAPAVHALGLMTFLGWMALGHGWEQALTAAIAVLIITCPCALALAVPAVQVAASSRLLARGIIVKAPDALERLAEIDTVVLDKTGTLTEGEPALADPAAVTDAVLARAATLAVASRHPYARAVVRAARARGLAPTASGNVAEVAGLGLSRRTADGEERLGSARWCEADEAAGAALWFRPATGRPVPFHFAHKLRADAGEVVATLKAAGLGLTLLSGDRAVEVDRIADAIGIADRAAGLLPQEKLARISELTAAGRRVLMVGDGLNDAPALAAGHASLSPSTAADISQTAADAIFQGRELAPVVEALAVSREVHRMAMQNFAIAIGYNAVFVPMAVVGIVTPLIAAIAMSASSIAVTANALRLRTKPLSLS